jgi:hypothetical protein
LARAPHAKAAVKRLEKQANTLPIEEWDRWFHTESAYTPAELLFFVLWPNHQSDRMTAACFYDQLWRENGDMSDAEFVKEFAEGMLSLQPA